MLIKQGGAGGGSVDIADAPKITFDGKWLPWHIEFYGGEAYWEAWFLSSGTLTVEGSYTSDAWGIGGGGTPDWGSGGGSTVAGTAGIPAMALGVMLTGKLAVTIGAGGSNGDYDPQGGGATMLGSALTCPGAPEPESMSIPSDHYKRYRFEDPDKAAEVGANRTNGDGRAQGGWLSINRAVGGDDGAQGDGFGAGGGYHGYAAPGALVIRISV